MDYRANLKQLLMRGQMFKLKRQGIVSMGSGISHMQIKDLEVQALLRIVQQLKE